MALKPARSGRYGPIVFESFEYKGRSATKRTAPRRFGCRFAECPSHQLCATLDVHGRPDLVRLVAGLPLPDPLVIAKSKLECL